MHRRHSFCANLRLKTIIGSRESPIYMGQVISSVRWRRRGFKTNPEQPPINKQVPQPSDHLRLSTTNSILDQPENAGRELVTESRFPVTKNSTCGKRAIQVVCTEHLGMLQRLPAEILLEILRHLAPSSLSSMSRTCRRAYDLFNGFLATHPNREDIFDLSEISYKITRIKKE